MLQKAKGMMRFLSGDEALALQQCLDRAEVLEDRLHELHDGVDKAVRTLNEATDMLADRSVGNREQVNETVQAALGTLYRVL